MELNIMAGATEKKEVTEIPSCFQDLVRHVVRAFYGAEHVIITDMLVRYVCMKEDDIAGLLGFEKEQLRANLELLRQDMIVEMRAKMLTGADGKAKECKYYFINYKKMMDMVKYKLVKIRAQIEAVEHEILNRVTYKCIYCPFYNLTADQVLIPGTTMYRCFMCKCEVEKEDMPPKEDLKSTQFDDQVKVLFSLLRQSDEFQLAPELLEPAPININAIRGITKKLEDTKRYQGFVVEAAGVGVSTGNTNGLPSQKKNKKRECNQDASVSTLGVKFGGKQDEPPKQSVLKRVRQTPKNKEKQEDASGANALDGTSSSSTYGDIDTETNPI